MFDLHEIRLEKKNQGFQALLNLQSPFSGAYKKELLTKLLSSG